MLTYSAAKQSVLWIHIIGGAPEAAANDLLAKKLRSEGAETHDVGDGLGVPAFGEHADRDNRLNLLSRLARPVRRCQLFYEGVQHVPFVEFLRWCLRFVSRFLPHYFRLRAFRSSRLPAPRPPRGLWNRCAESRPDRQLFERYLCRAKEHI